MTYKILGADHKEYGPVSQEQLIVWIKEGRANDATLAQAEGLGEWKPLSQFPEFIQVIAAAKSTLPPLPGNAPQPQISKASLETIMARDYHFEIGDCISKGFHLFKENMGLILGAFAIYMGVVIFIGILGAIPFVGPIFSIANLFVAVPLLAGLYYVILQTMRRNKTEVGDVFYGFKTRYMQLVLGHLVMTLLTYVSAIPGVLLLIPGILAFKNESLAVGIPVTILAVFVILIPVVYFAVSWFLTVPLIIDKGLDFWPAMAASRKRVGQHFLSVFLLMIVVALLNIVGLLCCLVGVFFTMIIGICALMYAYETMFSDPAATEVTPVNGAQPTPNSSTL